MEGLKDKEEIYKEVKDKYDYFVKPRKGDGNNSLIEIDNLKGVIKSLSSKDDWGYFLEDNYLYRWEGKFNGSSKIGELYTQDEVDTVMLKINATEIANKITNSYYR